MKISVIDKKTITSHIYKTHENLKTHGISENFVYLHKTCANKLFCNV